MSFNFKKTIIYLVVSYLIFAFIVWLSSSLVVKYFAKEPLQQQGVYLSDSSDIRFNLLGLELYANELELVDSKTDKTRISIGKIIVNLELLPLIYRHVNVTEVLLEDVTFAVSKAESKLVVAGFDLTSSEKHQLVAEQQVAQQKPSSLDVNKIINEFIEAGGFTFEITELLLANIQVSIDNDQQPHSLVFESARLSNVYLTTEQKLMQFDLVSAVDDAKLTVNASGKFDNNLGTVSLTTSLEGFELGAYHYLTQDIVTSDNQPLIQGLAGSIAADLSFDVSLAPDQIAINSQNINLELAELLLTTKDNIANLNEFTFSNNSAELLLFKDKLEGGGEFSLNFSELSATTPQSHQIISAIERIELNAVSWQLTGDDFLLQLPQLNIENIVAFDNAQTEDKAILSLGKLNVNQVQLAEKELNLSDISFSNLAITIVKDESGQLVNMYSLAKGNQQQEGASSADVVTENNSINETSSTPKEQDKSVSNNDKTFDFHLGGVKALGDITITVDDASVSPKFANQYVINKFVLGKISSKAPEHETALSIQGVGNKYTKFDINGKLKPLAEISEYAINSKITEFNLPPVSSYLKEPLGYEIESGQLDLTVKSLITDNQLDGNANVFLRGITLIGAEKKATDNNNSIVSFGKALNLLKDSDDNISLDLPLSGDLDSPSFGVSGLVSLLVKQATMSAAKDYLLTTFVPYSNVVKIAMAAGEYALKITFSDLTYDVEQLEFKPEQNKFLKEFALLMRENKELQVKLCGVSSALELGIADVEVLTKAQEQALLALSNQRIDLFKDYMVEQEQVESARLLSCKSRIGKKAEKKSRIKFISN